MNVPKMPNPYEAHMFEQWMRWCFANPDTPTGMMLEKPAHLWRYLEEKCKQEGIPYN